MKKEQSHVEEFIIKHFGEYAVNGFDVEKEYCEKFDWVKFTEAYNELEEFYSNIFVGYSPEFVTKEKMYDTFIAFARQRMESYNKMKDLVTCP